MEVEIKDDVETTSYVVICLLRAMGYQPKKIVPHLNPAKNDIYLEYVFGPEVNEAVSDYYIGKPQQIEIHALGLVFTEFAENKKRMKQQAIKSKK